MKKRIAALALIIGIHSAHAGTPVTCSYTHSVDANNSSLIDINLKNTDFPANFTIAVAALPLQNGYKAISFPYCDSLTYLKGVLTCIATTDAEVGFGKDVRTVAINVTPELKTVSGARYTWVHKGLLGSSLVQDLSCAMVGPVE